ncbi:MAG: hypothetical protein FWF01_02890 [Alphaproteobacteria bacterium]|nr:hypothetical protein [Alphaproteobacteria bacterium]
MTAAERAAHTVHIGGGIRWNVSGDEYANDLRAKIAVYNTTQGRTRGGDGYLDAEMYLRIKRGIEFRDENYTAERLGLTQAQFNTLKAGGNLVQNGRVRQDLVSAFNTAARSLTAQNGGQDVTAPAPTRAPSTPRAPAAPRTSAGTTAPSGARTGTQTTGPITPNVPFDQLPEEERIRIIMTWPSGRPAGSPEGTNWTEEDARNILRARENMHAAGRQLDEFMRTGHQETETDRRFKELYNRTFGNRDS